MELNNDQLEQLVFHLAARAIIFETRMIVFKNAYLQENEKQNGRINTDEIIKKLEKDFIKYYPNVLLTLPLISDALKVQLESEIKNILGQ